MTLEQRVEALEKAIGNIVTQQCTADGISEMVSNSASEATKMFVALNASPRSIR